MDLSPIVLFTYNRPQHTKQTIESLKKNRLALDSKLFIYSDGPKNTNESRSAVAEVRKYLKGVEGFRKITIIESKTNSGLAKSVAKGVSEVVNKHGSVIVLEDDLITHPAFLYYMNHALENYQNDIMVMQISGHMFDVNIEAETDAVFLPFISSWGWATWRRAWNHFDLNTSVPKTFKKDKALRYKFNLDGAYDYFRMLEAQMKGRIDSWAIIWYLNVFLESGLVLYPVRSFIQNIGFDGSGSHCGKSVPTNSNVNTSREEIYHQIHFPDVSLNQEAYKKIKTHLSSNRTFVKKAKKIISKLIVNRIY
ncbi:glycosyltransferase [bacterium]|nr:glycosyltransferase [bacterium]